MKSWTRNWKFIIDFDLIMSHLVNNNKIETDSEIRTVCRAFLIKFQNNMKGCEFFIADLGRKEMEQEKKESTLSVGLIMRGVVSDLINYLFLKGIYELGGADALKIEMHRLEAEFVKAYKSMLEMEHTLMNADDAIRKAGMDKLRERMPDYFEGEELKTGDSFVTEDHKKMLAKYWDTIAEKNEKGEKELLPRVSQEAGKLKFLGKHDNIVQLNLVYKYLSQYQHFSINGEKLFSHESLMPSEYFVELLIVLVCDAMISICDYLGLSSDYKRAFHSLGTKVIRANEDDIKENMQDKGGKNAGTVDSVQV